MCDQRLGALGFEGEVDGEVDGAAGLFVAAPDVVEGMLRVAGVDMSRFAAVC
jgi:hypothetical protein